MSVPPPSTVIHLVRTTGAGAMTQRAACGKFGPLNRTIDLNKVNCISCRQSRYYRLIKAERAVEELRSRGFDDSYVMACTSIAKCSQCQTTIINGTAYHEKGCPNNRSHRTDVFDDEEWSDLEDDRV